MAATVASYTLNQNLNTHRYEVRTRKRAYGISGSALQAAGFIASLTGTSVNPEATLTGPILPDGTIGPVDSLVEKFTAAIAAGKTRLGFPLGQRHVSAPDVKETIDLVTWAEKQGVQAIAVGNVYDAYHLLTNRTLPRSVPLPAEQMALNKAEKAALGAEFDRWDSGFNNTLRALNCLKGFELSTELTTRLDVAEAIVAHAHKMKQRGHLGVALHQLAEGARLAETVSNVADVMRKLQSGDVVAARKVLQTVEKIEGQSQQAYQRASEVALNNVCNQLRALAAFDDAALSWALLRTYGEAFEQALSSLNQYAELSPDQQRTPKKIRGLIQALMAAFYGYKLSTLQRATLFLPGVEAPQCKASPAAKGTLQNVARSYSSAVAGCSAYFHTVVRSTDGARVQYLTNAADREYSFTRSIQSGYEHRADAVVGRSWHNDPARQALASLGASVQIYWKLTLLIATNQAIGFYYLKDRYVPEVKYRDRLRYMLQSAERRAREQARAAKSITGEVSYAGRSAYQMGRALASGTTRERIESLEWYWRSAAYSQLAVMLAADQLSCPR